MEALIRNLKLFHKIRGLFQHIFCFEKHAMTFLFYEKTSFESHEKPVIDFLRIIAFFKECVAF
jgi:hypothetical protein